MRTTSSWTLLLDSRSDITILSGMRSFVRAIRATSHTKIEGLWLLHFKLSLVEKAEPAQVCFTLHLRDQRSKWMQDGYKRLHEYKFIAVAINWGRGHLWLYMSLLALPVRLHMSLLALGWGIPWLYASCPRERSHTFWLCHDPSKLEIMFSELFTCYLWILSKVEMSTPQSSN